jgi:uncharacterized protein YcfJ
MMRPKLQKQIQLMAKQASANEANMNIMRSELNALRRRIPEDVYQRHVVQSVKPAMYDRGKGNTLKRALYTIAGAGIGSALGSTVTPFGGTTMGALAGGYLGNTFGKDHDQDTRVDQVRYDLLKGRLEAARDIYENKYAL